ncbi:hypothetical protein U91I_03169 [alpha proteobacterium U9-1i]|nr:hypothetical protein U91I_03169 [alpha proteobacterium U9-1i]
MMNKLAFAFTVGLYCAFIAPPPVAMAQEAGHASIAQGRVHAFFAALSGGDAVAFEAAAQANYSPALLARRDAAQRAEFFQRIYGDFGALQLRNATNEGENMRVEVTGASGTSGVFTFTFDGTPQQKIEAIRVEAGGH